MNLKKLNIDESLKLKLNSLLEEFEFHKKKKKMSHELIQKKIVTYESEEQAVEEKENMWSKFYRLFFITEYET